MTTAFLRYGRWDDNFSSVMSDWPVHNVGFSKMALLAWKNCLQFMFLSGLCSNFSVCLFWNIPIEAYIYLPKITIFTGLCIWIAINCCGSIVNFFEICKGENPLKFSKQCCPWFINVLINEIEHWHLPGEQFYRSWPALRAWCCNLSNRK